MRLERTTALAHFFFLVSCLGNQTGDAPSLQAAERELGGFSSAEMRA